MTHALISKLTEMLEVQTKLIETAVDMLKPAIEAEREACAKVCDSLAVHPEYASEVTKLAAMAIRARGQT